MAILKHIKSRNANYSDALNYLLYQHDEKSGEPVLDDYGNKLLREEFYMDGLNCSPLSFDKECRMTNKKFNKNKKKEDIKSHHYIISFDPADATDCGLTGKRAQELCLEFARKNFPGYHALIVTHADGGNQSRNIHTHIVINSVRKHAVKRQSYMDKPNEEKAGYKHRSTKRFLNHLKKEVMEMCEREGLHQIDLLSPAPEKVTEAEFRAKAHGQKKMNWINKKIVQEGLWPAATTFQTQKDFLRNAINECSRFARTFEEFQNLLLEDYNISVILQRRRYRYLHPDRDRRITEKALGTKYGREHLEKIFIQNKTGLQMVEGTPTDGSPETDYHKDPTAIFYYGTKLQQMANTLIHIQEHGYDARENLTSATSGVHKKLEDAQKRLSDLNAEMKTLNAQIHYTGRYFASKAAYAEFLKSKHKKKYRSEHASEITAYEEARDWLKDFLS